LSSTVKGVLHAMSFTGLLFYKAIAGFYQCLNL
jgi:hypothetical protein